MGRSADEDCTAEPLAGLIPRTTDGAIVGKGGVKELEIAGAHEERTPQPAAAAALAALLPHRIAVTVAGTEAAAARRGMTGAAAATEPTGAAAELIATAAAAAAKLARFAGLIVCAEGATGIEIEGAATAGATKDAQGARDAPFAANRLVIAEGDMTDGDDAVVHIEPATSPQTATAAPPI